MGLFTEEQLTRLSFDSSEAAYKHLKIEAMKCGFKISTNHSLRSSYMTVFCSKGGRVRSERTSKTDCKWSLSIAPGSGKEFKIRPTCLEHNHELTPDKYSIFTLEPDKQDLIRKLLDSGATPLTIQRFLERSGTTDVSTLQIRRLAGRDKAFQNKETDDLRRYMEEVGGVFERLEVRTEGKCYVHAVFTAMDFEIENLRRFGDVIWLDGTQRQNFLKWEIIPVTLVDPFKRIRSGGMFFVSRGDQEILEWVLRVLRDNREIMDVLRTIITDEDSAFIPAFKSVFRSGDAGEDPLIKHVLCAFHKEQNFIRKLTKCGLTAKEVEAAKDLFKIVCYSPHRQACDDAVADIKTLSPKLAQYLEKHVEPILGQFARAYLSGVFTKGYNTTSPAESHNNMIKKGMIDGRIYTLKQMRIDITATHRNSEICFREKITSSFVNTHFTWTKHQVMLAPRIREAIDLAIERSRDFSVCLENSTVRHPDAPKYVYKISEAGCSCGSQSHAGIPCAHLLAFIRKQGRSVEDDFPVTLINDGWVIPDEDSVLIPVGRDGQIEDDHEEDEITDDETEDLVFPTGNPLEERPATAGFGERDLITALTDKNRFLEQKERYLVLFHLAKTVASISSRNAEVAEKIRGDLNEMLDYLLGLPETTAGASDAPADAAAEDDEDDEGDGGEAGGDDQDEAVEEVDVQDVIHRRRGRPKKQATVAEMFRGRRRCVLCGINHNIVECENYDDFKAAVEHNLSIEATTSRCSICKGIGHNRSTCGWYYANK